MSVDSDESIPDEVLLGKRTDMNKRDENVSMEISNDESKVSFEAR